MTMIGTMSKKVSKCLSLINSKLVKIPMQITSAGRREITLSSLVRLFRTGLAALSKRKLSQKEMKLRKAESYTRATLLIWLSTTMAWTAVAVKPQSSRLTRMSAEAQLPMLVWRLVSLSSNSRVKLTRSLPRSQSLRMGTAGTTLTS